MATLGTKSHSIATTFTPATSTGTGLGARSYTDTGTPTDAYYTEFTIEKGTADTTVSLGNLASFAHCIILASEAMDAVYFSTILNDIECGVGQDCVWAMGLDSEIDVLHIDCTGSAAAVNVKILLITEV